MVGFFADLSICLPFRQLTNFNDNHGSIDSEAPSKQRSCIFCHVSPENGFKVVWEVRSNQIRCGGICSSTLKLLLHWCGQDETFIAFQDHKPAAQHHLLIIPRSHIRKREPFSACSRVNIGTGSSGSVRSLRKSAVHLGMCPGQATPLNKTHSIQCNRWRRLAISCSTTSPCHPSCAGT